MKWLWILFLVFVETLASAQITEWNTQQSPDYRQLLQFYQGLAQKHPKTVKIESFGETDAGLPLTLVSLTSRKPNALRLLVLNGIHPGEPEGIDACTRLAHQWVSDPRFASLGVEVCIVAVYNIEGMLNRNAFSRANQNGPEAYGFRGNGQNLDLNRDMIKADSRNARTLARLFQRFNPDVFVDTHTSNGADYPAVMTLIATQRDKLGGQLAQVLHDRICPDLYRRISEMVPYVNSIKEVPDSGITAFLESPRFTTGYAALRGTIGFVTETHMLKPYPERVLAQQAFLDTLLQVLPAYSKVIRLARKADSWLNAVPKKEVVGWKEDLKRRDSIFFHGYESVYEPSVIGDYPRLRYQRDKPWARFIPWYPYAVATTEVRVPQAYIVPRAWEKVRVRLNDHGIRYREVRKDSLITLNFYRILDYQSGTRPYEGHYLHKEVKVSDSIYSYTLQPGDWIIPVQQPLGKLLVHLLEPQATDSYFNWNFFDAILQQKEYFSDYVFEDLAAELLKSRPELNSAFQKAFPPGREKRKDGQAVLLWIYRNSPYYETSHLRYPVGRIMGQQ